MTIYDTLDYKEFLQAWVQDRPGGGRGEYRKMAIALRVSTTLISQVIKGDKHFALELANDLCEYLGMSDDEAEHFLLLIDFARAGSVSYRKRLQRRLEKARAAALNLKNRIDTDRELSDSQSAIYYSSWVYTGLSHIIACNPEITIDQIIDRLRLSRSATLEVLRFLIESGIVLQKEGGLDLGHKRTHLPASSPLVVKHHQNWRLQGFGKMNFANEEDLFSTFPMSLSDETAVQIRRELPAFVEKITKWVIPSPSQSTHCMNIDWFRF